MKQIDFHTENQKLDASDQKFEQKLRRIVERDNLHQQAIAARGGVMTSSLSDEAEAAAAAVTQQRDNARAAHARPVIEASGAELAELAAETERTAHQFLAAWKTLAERESQRSDYIRRAGLRVPPRVSGESADAAAFLDRLARLNHVTERSRTAAVRRDPVPQPNYADLVAS